MIGNIEQRRVEHTEDSYIQGPDTREVFLRKIARGAVGERILQLHSVGMGSAALLVSYMDSGTVILTPEDHKIIDNEPLVRPVPPKVSDQEPTIDLRESVDALAG